MSEQARSIHDLINLEGRAAIITGADRGIGEAIAMRLAEAGADLYLTGLDQSALDTLQTHLQSRYSKRVETTVVNLQEKHSASDLVSKAMAHFPHLDMLVNNAGIFPQTPTIEITDDDFDRVIAINLRSAFIMSREFSKGLIKQEMSGVILNILSISALTTAGNATHYVASKHAMAGVTRSMAAELGPYGIRCLALAPGMIMTPGLKSIMDSSAELHEVFIDYAKSLPLGRAGEADEVACSALFAVSDLASFMTGSVITIDGGDLAQ